MRMQVRIFNRPQRTYSNRSAAQTVRCVKIEVFGKIDFREIAEPYQGFRLVGVE